MSLRSVILLISATGLVAGAARARAQDISPHSPNVAAPAALAPWSVAAPSGLMTIAPFSPPPRPPASPISIAATPMSATIAIDTMRSTLEAYAGAPGVDHGARAAIEAVYAARGFAPLWRDGAQWSLAARAATARVERADEDGLDVPAPLLNEGDGYVLAQIDLALSLAVVDYGRQASGARLDPRAIDKLITEKPEIAQAGAILAAVANAGDADAALQAFNPPQPGYAALRQKLAEARASVGSLAPATGAPPLEAEIIANMERWRWLPRAMPSDEIVVNIPDYTVVVKRDGAVIHRARVVVGKPSTPTPVFSNRMQFIEVNPYWNVPESIIKKEMAPKLAQDPTYLQRMGYEVTMVNGRMSVRQPPGERNALGRIKFMFPNEHAVYLHDTPQRGFFANAKRAFSHGCVRVDQPFALAEVVLGRDNGWTREKIEKLIGGANRVIPLPKPIAIHIEYFTAFVDEAGALQLREDIYGYSRKVRAALHLRG